MVEPAIVVGGLPIPDGRPVFLAVLGLHVAAGLWCVVTGAAAALSRKQRGAHPRRGGRYVAGLWVLTVTLTALAVLRWPHTVHLLVIGWISLLAALAGVAARRHRRPGWVRRHALGLTASYVGLWTGFLVDNGPLLLGWRELPHILHWTLPALVGSALLTTALIRRGRRPVPLAPTRAGGPPQVQAARPARRQDGPEADGGDGDGGDVHGGSRPAAAGVQPPLRAARRADGGRGDGRATGGAGGRPDR